MALPKQNLNAISTIILAQLFDILEAFRKDLEGILNYVVQTHKTN